jgi:GntR family transcriptional regulator/MocR family aminotransferase
LCARLLLSPGDEVGFENPGYQGARRIFEAAGARLRPIAVRREGIALSDLG